MILIITIELVVGNIVYEMVRIIITLEQAKKKRQWQACSGVDYIFQWEEPDLLQ